MTEQEIAETNERRKPGPKKRRSRLVEASVMLDRADTERLDQLAAEQGESRSALIREAVRKTFLRGRAGNRSNT